MSILEMYADGSLGNRRIAGLGWVLVTEDAPLVGFQGLKVGTAHANSQHVELAAIKAAIKSAIDSRMNFDHAVIYSDSQSALDLIAKAVDGYGRGRPSHTEALHRELTRWISVEARIAKLHFRHVKGHNGAPGNEAADRLAVLARRNKEFGLDRHHGNSMASVIAADFTAQLRPRALTAETHWPSPASISTHRAMGEPLCSACKFELRTLEREAS